MAIVMVLSMAACDSTNQNDNTNTQAPSTGQTSGDNSQAPPPPAQGDYVGKTLTVVTQGEPEFLLGQAGVTGINSTLIIKAIFNTLYEPNEKGELVPCIAKSYEWVDDLHIRVFLRDDVYDVKGNKITAEDVLFSFVIGLESGQNAVAYTESFTLDEWVIEDDYTLVIALCAPNATVWDTISDYAFQILSKKSFEELGGMAAASMNPLCGTGRYKFKEWVPGQYIEIEYNENYWDKSFVPAYQFMRLTFVGDSAARVMAVQSGAADVALELSAPDVMGVRNDPNITIHETPLNRGTTIYFNCSREPFGDARVRQAIKMLIDPMDAVAIAGGVVTQTGVVPGHPYHWAEGANIPRTVDIEGAKALLAEAGFPNGFSFELMVEPAIGFDTIAQAIQSRLAAGGIDMVLSLPSFPDYFGRMPTCDYDAILTTAGMGTTLTVELRRFDGRYNSFESRGGAEYMNPALNDLMDTYYFNTDANARRAAVIEIQKILFEEAPVIGFNTHIYYSVSRTGIGNIVMDLFGFPQMHFIRPV